MATGTENESAVIVVPTEGMAWTELSGQGGEPIPTLTVHNGSGTVSDGPAAWSSGRIALPEDLERLRRLYGPSGQPLGVDHGHITVNDSAHGSAETPLLYIPSTVDRLTAQIERLASLLELNDDERAFVRAALAKDADRGLWLVLADYLAEKGKEEAERAFRRLAGQPIRQGL